MRVKQKSRVRRLVVLLFTVTVGAGLVWKLDLLALTGIPALRGTKPKINSERHVDIPSGQQPESDLSWATAIDGQSEPASGRDENPVALNLNLNLLAEDESASTLRSAPLQVESERSVENERTAAGESFLASTTSTKDIVPLAGSRAPAQQSSSQQSLQEEQLEEIDRLIAESRDLAAHEKLSDWYWEFPTDRPRFQQRLDALVQTIYFSSQPNHQQPYVIQPGDQLRKIARKYHVSWQYLARLNRVNPRRIRAGQKLKVIEGPFGVVIDISDHELTVVCHGQFVRNYPVGVGKDGTTPLGKFAVQKKLEDPTYFGPEGQVIANDDPANPLGERWIDIGDGYGIHGTIDPDSIGKNQSRGCIRLLNANVEEVYDLLTVGSTVWIKR